MQNPALSARQVVQLITQSTGVSPRENTVDTFKCGDPDAIVRGVAVTMMPTLEVLQKAVEIGANLVIAHEPLFYGHHDVTSELERENDAVCKAKRDFLAQNGLILWRFHDLPHWQNPDAILSGMADELGWREFQNRQDDQLFQIPPTTLDALARQIREKLQIETLRVVGDSKKEVANIALAPGAPGFKAHRQLLQSPNVEVLVMGEAPEWETVAYAVDARAAGFTKALLIVGHIPSEQGGMKACARWLQTLLPLPVSYLSTPEPFWTPSPDA